MLSKLNPSLVVKAMDTLTGWNYGLTSFPANVCTKVHRAQVRMIWKSETIHFTLPFCIEGLFSVSCLLGKEVCITNANCFM